MKTECKNKYYVFTCLMQIVRFSEMFIYPVEEKESLAIFWHFGSRVDFDNIRL